ncbi:MAG: hypothetical protein LC737_07595 [Chloroflexi bacterium]|nr:hypothetical protein [Chloroflexota bacterium]
MTKNHLVAYWLFAVIALAVSACDPTPLLEAIATAQATPVTQVVPGTPPAVGGTDGMPVLTSKPQPVETTYKGCPPDGDGGDRETNRLKNRVDDAVWIPVPFETLMQLQWPSSVEQKRRDRWPARERQAVERWEGIPVSIEGYLQGAKEEGPEATNCHGADYEFHDFHLWLTQTADEDRTRSIVVEVTPRVREKHPSWTTTVLGRLVRNNTRVRISGWTMLDPEHPDQIGKTRGTIWEIHPIMLIEVQQQGRWLTLDDYAK